VRRYDDPVEVRQGTGGAEGAGSAGAPAGAPAQFLWRGRLWQVRDVQARWVETGAWWRSAAARSALGVDGQEQDGRDVLVADRLAVEEAADQDGERLLAEREVWRVAAGRGQLRALGVFDLARDVATGRWQLVGCLD